VYGLKHTLTLVRKSNDDAVFRHNDAAAGKVSLDKISWFALHDLPADERQPERLRDDRLIICGVQTTFILVVWLRIFVT